MLIAPIFHNNYLSPKHPESQNKSSDAVSNASSSTKISEASPSAKYNNIFKSAFNRGINFLSKITHSSGSNTPSTSASTSSKPAESETNQDSSSSETPSDCSSPDSLKTELIFFKPIIREPKTPSSSKPVLLRIPSIRSTASSTDRFISSPCPSPFFIPITPRRQSAFSLVGMPEDDFREDESQSSIIKPKATKRKSLKSSPEKPPAKRLKQDVQAKQKIVKAYKPANVKEKFKVEANSDIVVAAKRKTRSTDKSDDQEFQKPKSLPPKSKRKLTESKTLSKKEDAPVVKKYQQNKKTSPIVLKEQPKRVTRSQSIKH